MAPDYRSTFQKPCTIFLMISDYVFQGEKLGLGSLFGSRLVATNTIVMCINWIVTNLCYYGLILHSVDLAGRYDHYGTILHKS